MKLRDKLITLGATGLITITVVANILPEKDVVDEKTPVEIIQDICKAGETCFDVGDQKVKLIDEDFAKVKDNLKADLERTGYVNIMDMYGKDGNIFIPVLNAEVKKKGGVVFNNFNNETAKDHIKSLLNNTIKDGEVIKVIK